MAWRKRLTGKWFTLERILVTTDESETRLLRRWHIRGANRKKKTRIISLHWQFRSTRVTASNQLNLRPFCLLDFSVWWKISSSFFFFSVLFSRSNIFQLFERNFRGIGYARILFSNIFYENMEYFWIDDFSF